MFFYSAITQTFFSSKHAAFNKMILSLAFHHGVPYNKTILLFTKGTFAWVFIGDHEVHSPVLQKYREPFTIKYAFCFLHNTLTKVFIANLIILECWSFLFQSRIYGIIK